ncbi:MAG: diguanylate cyclase [Marinobacter sp.]|nr:diguanylate cyclase [Marinobacter sp.]
MDGYVYSALLLSGIVIVLLVLLQLNRRRLARHDRLLVQRAQQLRAHQVQLHRLFDHADMLVVIFPDKLAEASYANRYALEHWQVKDLGALNQQVFLATDNWAEPPYSRQDFVHRLYRARQGGHQRFDWLFKHGGVKRWQTVSMSTAMLGDQRVVVMFANDITAHKEVESQEYLRDRILMALAREQHPEIVLDRIAGLVRRKDPQAMCAIYMVNEDGRTLRYAGGEGLPTRFAEAVAKLSLFHGDTSMGSAAAVRRKVVTDDMPNDAAWRAYQEEVKHAGIRSCWAEPIQTIDGEISGVFAIFHREAWWPTDENVELMTGPASLAGLAIESARARARLHRQAHVERTLREISTSLVTLSDDQLDEGIHGVLRILGTLMHADRCYLLLADQAQECYRAPYQWAGPGLAPRFDARTQIPDEDLAAARDLLWQKQLLHIVEPEHPAPDALAGTPLLSPPPHALLMVPVYRAERLLGMLAVEALVGARHWPESDVTTVKVVAGLLANSLIRKELLDELTYEANHDRLTGLFNRHKIDASLQQEIARSDRYTGLFSIILFDADHFKQVNDNFGHNSGDEVLKSIARIARTQVRKSDIVGRWGGEEFLIVLPETDQDGAAKVADNIRIAVAQHDFGLPRRITVSSGVACYQGAEAAEELLQRADNALYRAKEKGRNRVELS